MSKVVTKIGRKGVIVIPKKIREILGIDEGSLVTIDVREGSIMIIPFTPKRVKLGGKASEILREVREEELSLEK